MNIADFKKLAMVDVQEKYSQLELALWYVLNGDWHACHDLLQHDNSARACWLHAILHKIEGDAGNSRYWYSRSGLVTYEKFAKNVDAEFADFYEQIIKK